MLSCGAKPKKETMITIETNLGVIKVKLYEETPQHKANFEKLVKKKFYDGILFHRVIKDFMVQAGDPDSKEAPAGKHLGSGGPGYTVPAEFVFPHRYHKRGALSAARQGDQVNPEKASSGSQFYIVWGKTFTDHQLDSLQEQKNNGRERAIFNRLVKERAQEVQTLRENEDQLSLMLLQDELKKAAIEEVKNSQGFTFTAEQRESYKTVGGTPHLDTDYTVFGEVVEGLEIIDAIQKVKTGQSDRPVEDVKIIKARIEK